MKEQKQSAWTYIFGTMEFILLLPIIVPYIAITSIPIAWRLANWYVGNKEEE